MIISDLLSDLPVRVYVHLCVYTHVLISEDGQEAVPMTSDEAQRMLRHNCYLVFYLQLSPANGSVISL